MSKSLFEVFSSVRVEESRDGTVVTALASHQCGLGSIPAQCHIWVEFAVGSRLILGFYLGF